MMLVMPISPRITHWKMGGSSGSVATGREDGAKELSGTVSVSELGGRVAVEVFSTSGTLESGTDSVAGGTDVPGVVAGWVAGFVAGFVVGLLLPEVAGGLVVPGLVAEGFIT